MLNLKHYTFAVILLLALSACGKAHKSTSTSIEGTEVNVTVDTSAVSVVDQDSGLDPKWFKNGSFMEINVRAFSDGNSDGVGDLKGVTQRLDYLKDLGITGIWLMPITDSSEHDHGYTTRDYRKLDSDYGTEADLVELVQEAHKRGIGIILDYVMNHSDSENPLFLNSKSAKHAKYRNWFVWQNNAPKGWVNFTNTSPWTTVDTGAYYSIFWFRMPDFNLRNPEVVEYHKNNLRYWLNLGVDGFRFDAIGTFIENGPGSANQFVQPENYALMRELRPVIHEYQKRYLVCEDPGMEVETASQSGCGSAFAINGAGLNYQMRQLAQGDLSQLSGVANYSLNKSGRIATVLANHDRFAGHRLMDELHQDETAYRLAAATYITMSGIPFVYYGEEIGQAQMPITKDVNSDWPQRGPMSWSTTPDVTDNTVVGPYTNYFAPSPNHLSHNVASELANANSLLNFYSRLLNLRKSSPALRMGDYRVLKVTAKSSIIERRLNDESVIIAINYANSPETTTVSGVDQGLVYSNALAFNASGADITLSSSTLNLALPARSIQIFKANLADQRVYKNTELYVRGNMNNWAVTPAAKLTYVAAGIYEVTLSLTNAQTYYFKIGTTNWSGYNFGGATAADQPHKSANASHGVKTELEQVGWHNGGGNNGDDVQLDITTPGFYTFRLDARDALNPTIEVKLAL